MTRTPANPTEWGLAYEMNQGEVVEGATRHLRCSGQVDLVEDPEAEMGLRVTAPNDARAQLQAALSAVDDVLAAAGMDRSNLVFVRFYATDVDAVLQNYDVYAGWIGEAGVRPPQSMIGVARLVLPELRVEVEVEAAA